MRILMIKKYANICIILFCLYATDAYSKPVTRMHSQKKKQSIKKKPPQKKPFKKKHKSMKVIPKYICDICLLKFMNLSGLISHKEAAHNVCRFCLNQYDDYGDLVEHIWQDHNNKYIDICFCKNCGETLRKYNCVKNIQKQCDNCHQKELEEAAQILLELKDFNH